MIFARDVWASRASDLEWDGHSRHCTRKSLNAAHTDLPARRTDSGTGRGDSWSSPLDVGPGHWRTGARGQDALPELLRVLPRSVQGSPSSPPSCLRCQATGLDEGVQRTRGDIQDLGDRCLGDLLAQQHPDLALFPIELRRTQGAFGTTEQCGLGLGRQPAPPSSVRRSGPSRSRRTARTGRSSPWSGGPASPRSGSTSLIAIEADLPLDQLVDDLDHLAQAPTQPGQLADDQAVPRRPALEQLVDTASGPGPSGRRLEPRRSGRRRTASAARNRGSPASGWPGPGSLSKSAGRRPFSCTALRKGLGDFYFANTEP